MTGRLRRETKAKLVEFNALSPDQKWRYLQAYWPKASRFYGFKDGLIVPDEETNAQIGKFKSKPSPKLRRVISLRDWRCKLDPEMQGVRKGYFKHDYTDDSWERVTTPHNVNYTPLSPVEFGKIDTPWYNYPSLDKPTTIYLGEYALWYRTSVPLTREELEGKRVFIKFESCSIKTTAWVDEWPVILEHFGVYPFEMEVTEELIKSQHNEKQITLEVVSTPSNTPDVFYNCLEYTYVEKRGDKELEGAPFNWGGINGAVELVLTSPVYLKDLFMFTKSIADGKAIVHIRLEVENTTRDLFEGKAALEIKHWYPEEASNEKRVTINLQARPLTTTVLEKDVTLSNPALWESWDPHLYLVHATLAHGSELCDDVYETFGVRTFTAKDGRFFLNGRPITLAATHDMGLYPNASPTCPPDYWIVQDCLIHKALGAVAARYPSDNRVHYRRIAECADQIGIMLIWEGYCSLWSQSPNIETLSERDIPALVRDLRNHPSIIVWTLGDETYYYDPADSIYHNKRSHYVQLVHQLATNNDPSRLVVPVGHWVEDLVLLVEKNMGKRGVDAARRRAIDLLPIFNSPNIYWAIHSLPSGADTKPVYEVMRRYQKILCDAGKPVTFDEFACEGMPNWDLCKGEWWYKHWTIHPLFPSGKKFLEPKLIGRELGVDDWRVSQAYQASVYWRILSFIRESEAFAGFSNWCLRDAPTSYAGLVDTKGRGKLAFFLLRSMLSRFFISAMHGNFAYKRDDRLEVTVSNKGPTVKGARLEIKVRNENDIVVDQKTVARLTINRGLTKAVDYALKTLQPDLYSIEYRLHDQTGKEIGKSLDVFYVE